MAVTLTHTSVEHILTKFSSKHTKRDGSHEDWAHWSSPTLLVSLAVSSTTNGAVNAARLVVLWRRNPEGPEIALEELDLLQFSTVPTSLRAVYNDALLGIRYMHPLHQVPATFNQIQVRFRNAADALNFVSHLNRFCPCKEELARPNTGPTIRPPVLPAQPRNVVPRASFAITSHPPMSSPRISSSPLEGHPPSLPSVAAGPVIGAFSGVAPTPLDSTHMLQKPTYNVAERSSSLSILPRVCNPTGNAVPSSTQKPVESTITEIPSLYQLTTPELESAVGEIIREPGFLEFLGRVEGMWRIRGLLGK